MTSRQILGRQMDRNGINQLRLKIKKKKETMKKQFKKQISCTIFLQFGARL